MNNTEAVVLPAGYTGSSLFHSVLTQTAARYPNVFASVAPPTSAAAFKRDYGTILARFEAARVRAPERVAIAREIVRVAQEALQYGVEGTSVPLREYLRERAPTPVLERSAGFGNGLPIEVPFEGRTYRGKEGIEVLDRLREAYQLSEGAYAGLKWIMEQEHVDLRGERFVLLGAGAELAPTEFLLRAGAEVLWIDVSDPGRARALGSLTHAPGIGNLLEQPREIAAAIRAFAEGAPVHIGMYAYAPGASKEWRLGAAMNAIVASLEPALLRSVSLLISPTTPAVLSEQTLQAAELRKASSPLWQRLLTRSGLTVEPGWLRVEDTCISLSTVALQGLSYQAAQYISKIAAAEMYAVYGTALDAEAPRPLKVSANVAGITRTRSLSHPLFNAAFLGASQFGVRIFDPATTRALSGLLMLHDLLNPNGPTARAESALDKARAVSSQPIHGGIYGLPWELEGVIRVAAVVGLANRPTILLEKPAPSIALAE